MSPLAQHIEVNIMHITSSRGTNNHDWFKGALGWAREWGLEKEFIYGYKKMRREGYDVPTSCHVALKEWDI